MKTQQRGIVLEQSGSNVRIVFMLESEDDADAMIEGLYQQMKAGEISIVLDGGKGQRVENLRLKHLN